MSEKPEAANVLEETAEVVEDKMGDYGNSWEKGGVIKRVMADPEGPLLVELYEDGTYDIPAEEQPTQARVGREGGEKTVEAVVLADTPQATSTFEENADDVITRLLDKLVRTYNLLFLKDEPDVENESTEDAAQDMAGYSAMLTSLIRRQ